MPTGTAELVEDAVANGAELLAGGTVQRRSYVRTVLSGVTSAERSSSSRQRRTALRHREFAHLAPIGVVVALLALAATNT